MATTFKLKRKLYSDDEKKGMGTGTKLALGGAAAVGGTILAGRKGMLGKNIQGMLRGKGFRTSVKNSTNISPNGVYTPAGGGAPKLAPSPLKDTGRNVAPIFPEAARDGYNMAMEAAFKGIRG